MTIFKVGIPCGLILLLALALVGGGLTSMPVTVPSVTAPLFVPQPVIVPRDMPRATEHTDNHKESTAVRVRYNSRMCDTVLAYYSISRGTLLFLCGIPQSETYGGLVFKITENYGNILLGDDAYTNTVFIGNRSYWNTVLSRDGYKLFSAYVTLQGLVGTRWPGLYW